MDYALKILITVFGTLILSQILKVMFESLRDKNFDISHIIRTGGMPSSHTASLVALSTSIFVYEKMSVGFVISCTFAMIVIFDALGVRKETGEQATVLNKLMKKDHIRGKKFYELVGHTPLQVGAGILLGILAGMLNFFL